MAKTKNAIPTEADKQEFYELMIDLLDNDDEDNDWYFTLGQARVLNHAGFDVPSKIDISVNGTYERTIRFHVEEEEEVSKFTPVTRFVCNYCKKDFKTDTKHNCKRDPIKRNCFSCRHNTGWTEEEHEAHHPDYLYLNEPYIFVDCSKGNEMSALEISEKGHWLNCPDWEPKEDEE